VAKIDSALRCRRLTANIEEREYALRHGWQQPRPRNQGTERIPPFSMFEEVAKCQLSQQHEAVSAIAHLIQQYASLNVHRKDAKTK
jgi:hypothetical protein